MMADKQLTLFDEFVTAYEREKNQESGVRDGRGRL